MKFFCTDLDNTLIYSYKHDIGKDKRNVEIYQGREISFLTEKTQELLQKVGKKYQIVPVTTRTKEQYERIQLGLGTFPYALVCNGGILLKNGEKDLAWYEKSKQLAASSREDLKKAACCLEAEPQRTLEVRFIEELFVFTKCKEPEKAVEKVRRCLNSETTEIFHNGEKVYVVPKSCSKGNALKRLRTYLAPESIAAAGDSEFDISMVEEADLGLVPYGFLDEFGLDSPLLEMEKDKLFSEALLETLLSKCL